MIGKYAEFARIAARQVMRKRTRFILTVLGIAIGVAAVVGIISLGEGIRAQSVTMIEEQSDLTLLEVTPGMRDGTLIPLTSAKARALGVIPHVCASAGVVRDAYSTGQQTYLGITGISTAEMEGVFSPAYYSGGSFGTGTSEVVLGYDIADKLRRFEGIRQGDSFSGFVREYDESGMPDDTETRLTVAGVLMERDDLLDDMVFMDAGTVQAVRSGETGYDTIYLRVDTPDNVFYVVQEVRSLGLDVHGAFEEIESINSLMDILILILSFFTGISLIVGVLMIINTMVISVFERTREIGVTMAVGASQRDVMALILFECLYIGFIGGICGDLLGILFSGAINTIGKTFVVSHLGENFSFFAGADITLIPPSLLLLGMVIAIVLSLLSGIYPAYRAAHLNPVEAFHNV